MTFYNVRETWTEFPSEAAYRNMWVYNHTSYPIEYWRENGIQARVHYASMIETRIEKRRKYSFIDTISAFGGLGGFMLGASLITVLEIAVLLYEVLHSIRNIVQGKIGNCIHRRNARVKAIQKK